MINDTALAESVSDADWLQNKTHHASDGFCQIL